MLLFVLKLNFQGKDNLSMKFITGANKALIASPVTEAKTKFRIASEAVLI